MQGPCPQRVVVKTRLSACEPSSLRAWGLNPPPVGYSPKRDALLHNAVRGLRQLGSLTGR